MTIQAITLPINLELSSKSKALLDLLRSLETDAPAAKTKPTASITPPAMGEYWEGQGGRYICTLPALLGMPERHLIVGDGEAEAALMNEGKALAEACGNYIAKLRSHPQTKPDQAPTENGSLQPLDQRWISIGATDLQRGFMAVIRGIAQPTTF